MKRKIAFALLLVVVVIAVLGAVKASQFRKLMAGAKGAAMPPESVSTAVVREEDWQDTLGAIGSITAAQGVMVSPDVAGTVQTIAFEAGATVAKGDLLVKLDTSVEDAQLQAVKAQFELAEMNLKRARTLRNENTVSVSELDTAESAVKQLQGNAEAISAQIEKKTIRAPFAGRLGIRLVNLGQYLEAGKAVVSLQSLTPVYGNFSLPQQELAKLKQGMKVRLLTDAYAAREFEGTLTAINPDLDTATRSVSLQATFENRDEALRPGMFARMEVLLPREEKVLVIPATSVLSAPYGDSVYVVESRGEGTNTALTVRQQFIRPGRGRGDLIAVETGLRPGERVVSAGVLKLRNGMAVVEHNELAPKAAEAPRPADS